MSIYFKPHHNNELGRTRVTFNTVTVCSGLISAASENGSSPMILWDVLGFTYSVGIWFRSEFLRLLWRVCAAAETAGNSGKTAEISVGRRPRDKPARERRIFLSA